MSASRKRNSETIETVILLPVDAVASQFFESEEIQWTRKGFEFESLSDDTSGPTDEEDIGRVILRHGGAVKNIHSYFSNIESRKCCMNLTPCQPTTFSNIRLVRNDGRDSRIEDGAIPRRTSFLTSTNILTKKDFTVYKHAILCAHFPVLCAPAPPGSPTPSPNPNLIKEEPVFKFGSFVDTPSQLTVPTIKPRPLSPTEYALDQQEEAASLVQSEGLRELLRQVFGLTKERASEYNRKVYEGYGRKPPARILVEELVGQLSVLENNKHPFYKPTHFIVNNSYDTWQQHERKHISELINKFWHYSLPPLSTGQSVDLSTVHEEYEYLMTKLIQFECLSYDRHSGPIPMSPLSATASRLLKEFGLRYGIGELYRRIVYLEYLSNHLESEVWYIEHTHNVLQSVMEMLPQNRGRVVIVKREIEKLQKAAVQLHGQCGNFLSKIKRLFPENKPIGGTAALVELMNSVIQLKTYLTGKKQQSLKDCLRHYSLESFATAYERHKTIAASDLHLDSALEPLSPKLLNNLLLNIRDEVTDYRTNYQPTFEKYFDISRCACKSFYDMLMADVEELCDTNLQEASPDEIDLLMVSLAYRLAKLDSDWFQFIPPEAQKWRHPFILQGLHWLGVLRTHLQQLVLQAVAAEKAVGKFQVLKLKRAVVETPRSTPSWATTSHPGRSSPSGKSLTPSLNSAFNSVMRNSGTPSGTPPIGEADLNIPKIYTNSCTVIPEADVETSPRKNLPNQRQEQSHVMPSTNQITVEADVHSHIAQKGKLPSVAHPSLAGIDPLRPTSLPSDDEILTFPQAGELRRSNSSPNLSDDARKKIPRNPILSRHYSFNSPEQIRRGAFLEDGIQTLKGKRKESDDNETSPMKVIPGVENGAVGGLKDLQKDHNSNVPFVRRTSVAESEPELEFPQVTVDTALPPLVDGLETQISFSGYPSFGKRESIDSTLSGSLEGNLGEGIRFRSIEGSSSQNSSISKQGSQRTEHFSSPNTNYDQPFMASTASTLVTPAPSLEGHFGSYVIPMSGSMFDTLALLQRVIGFAKTLCETLCPFPTDILEMNITLEENDSGKDSPAYNSYRDVMKEVCLGREQIFNKLLQSVSTVIILYGDNLMCLDLCGTPLRVGMTVLGMELIEHLKMQRIGQLIWGCRHDMMDMKSCFDYIHRDSMPLGDRYEPITQDMCTRINNVKSLLVLLPQIWIKMQRAADMPRVAREAKELETPRSSPQTETTTTSTPPDGASTSSQEDGSPDEANQDPPKQGMQGNKRMLSTSEMVYTQCKEHLMMVMAGQVRLLAYRINLFFRDALHYFTSSQPSYSMERHITPLKELLQVHLTSLNKWLYRESYLKVTEVLWKMMVEDFEYEAGNLKSSRGNTELLAEMLLEVIAHFIRILNEGDHGLDLEFLSSRVENANFLFQLYTTPTVKLMTLFFQLQATNRQDNMSLGSEIPTKSYLEMMQHDLHAIRKCFSGMEMVKWILNHPEGRRERSDTGHFGTPNSTPSLDSPHERAVELCQKLLEAGVICSVEDDIYLSSGRKNTFSDTDGSSDPFGHNVTLDSRPQSAYTYRRHNTSSESTSASSSPSGARSGGQRSRQGDESDSTLKDGESDNDEMNRSASANVTDSSLETLTEKPQDQDPQETSPQKQVIDQTQANRLSLPPHIRKEVERHINDTPLSMSSSRSCSTTCGLYIFQDSNHYFYCFTNIFDSLNSETVSKTASVHDIVASIRSLVQQDRVFSRTHQKPTTSVYHKCLDKQVGSDFIISILYSRRKYDSLARDFLRDYVASEIMDRVETGEVKPFLGCFGGPNA